MTLGWYNLRMKKNNLFKKLSLGLGSLLLLALVFVGIQSVVASESPLLVQSGGSVPKLDIAPLLFSQTNPIDPTHDFRIFGDSLLGDTSVFEDFVIDSKESSGVSMPTGNLNIGYSSAPSDPYLARLLVDGAIRVEHLADASDSATYYVCVDEFGQLQKCANTQWGTVINGVCGIADGGSFPSAPTLELCALNGGTASLVTTGPGTYSWTCNGSGGGTNASCSATIDLGGGGGGGGTPDGHWFVCGADGGWKMGPQANSTIVASTSNYSSASECGPGATDPVNIDSAAGPWRGRFL